MQGGTFTIALVLAVPIYLIVVGLSVVDEGLRGAIIMINKI